jgi:uncharacterized protein
VKRWLRGIMPDRREILNSKYLRVFGTLLHEPNLWHLNRRSASGAFALGLFVMYLPPVGHMLMATAGAIKFRVNLPISLALVWISNPVTMPPMYYFAYVVGALIMGERIRNFEPNYWLDWHHWLGVVGPALLGCLICGAVCSLLGYLTIQALWRWSLMRQIQRRKLRYAAARANKPSSSRQT